MVFGGYYCFLVVLSVFWWFLVVHGNFLVVIGGVWGSWWFLVVHGGYWWFLVVIDGSWWFLCFLVVLGGS